jgi:hypothetical protein
LTLVVGAPDFTATITPTFQAANVGGTAQYIITCRTIGSRPYGKPLEPQVSGLPVGVTATLTPPSIDPDKNGSSILTLHTSNFTPPGGYYPYVLINGNGHSHGSYISVGVSSPPTSGDFSGAFYNTAQTAAPGSPAAYTLNVSPTGGFDGTIALTVSGLPDDAVGSFSPSVLQAGGGSSTLTVTVDTGTPSGVYDFTVSASSGSKLIHSTTLTLLVGVQDFTGNIVPLSETVTAGGQAQYNVSLSSLGNSIYGQVNLTVANLPPGVTGSFSPNPTYTFGQSVLNLSTTSATPPGTHTLLVTAIGPTTSHSRTVTLTVVPSLGSIANSGSLNTGRAQQTAVQLTTGKVLVAGGTDPTIYPSQQFASVEIYDPMAAAFSYTGNLTNARSGHTATLLNNGKVLITGGNDNSSPQPVTLSSAELYDPSTGIFTLTGSMSAARAGHTAALLPNGKVLITGGGPQYSSLASAEIYDPATGVFTVTGSMSMPRQGHTATPLNNGKVLIVGGQYYSPSATAEVYDAASGVFTLTGSLANGRQGHTATRLNSGKVLIAGGGSAAAELYDPAVGTFSVTGSMYYPRSSASATLLSNGLVLVAGGTSAICCYAPVAATEVYDPSTGSFIASVPLSTPRYAQTQNLLGNGNVLITGGDVLTGGNSGAVTSAAELFTPATLAPPGLSSITISSSPSSLAVGNSVRLTATGKFSDGSTQTLASAIWTSSNASAATVTNDATNFGAVYAVTPGTATIQACTGTICASTLITVPSP